MPEMYERLPMPGLLIAAPLVATFLPMRLAGLPPDAMATVNIAAFAGFRAVLVLIMLTRRAGR